MSNFGPFWLLLTNFNQSCRFQEAAPFVPDEGVLAQLVDMGFSRNGCTRALYETKNSGVEAAMNWVMEHMGDANFNDPFVDPK